MFTIISWVPTLICPVPWGSRTGRQCTHLSLGNKAKKAWQTQLKKGEHVSMGDGWSRVGYSSTQFSLVTQYKMPQMFCFILVWFGYLWCEKKMHNPITMPVLCPKGLSTLVMETHFERNDTSGEIHMLFFLHVHLQ